MRDTFIIVTARWFEGYVASVAHGAGQRLTRLTRAAAPLDDSSLPSISSPPLPAASSAATPQPPQ
jgi:hypothetical protein